MLITSYNKAGIGDVLIAILGPDAVDGQSTISQNDITQIMDDKTGQVTGYNFFNISKLLPDFSGNGQVYLTESEINILNTQLKNNGFEILLSKDNQPKIVVGFVQTCEAHPDSDHLHVTSVDVGQDAPLQIVCGAPNVEQGQKVVAALSGAMMPDGKIIWPGSLRGVASAGMLCSARELAIPNAPAEHGILILPADAEVGRAFSA